MEEKQETDRFLKAKNRKFEGLDNEKWEKDFFFVQLADPQLGFIQDLSGRGPGLHWEEELKLVEKGVEIINKWKPKFAICCGDLTHATPPSLGMHCKFNVTFLNRIS